MKTDTCKLCDGMGKRGFFSKTGIYDCKACDGTGEVPSMTKWRPSDRG